MANYLIVRHGCNLANQPITPRLALGVVSAKNRKEAEQIAHERWSFYHGQHSEVILFSRAAAADRLALNP